MSPMVSPTASKPAVAHPILKEASVTDLTDPATIEFNVCDHVATVTLNRPERMNAFNQQMAEEITAAWARVRDDEDIHVAVLRANGERAFCTGLDVREGRWWMDQPIFNQEDPGAVLGPKSHRVWKPVIGALHGMVAGGAMYFVNECDFAICSESATFFDPHANAGIVSALEPMGMLALGLPFGEVMRWALLGNEERITAQTALRIGLVTEIVPDDQLRSRAAELAGEIAARRPAGVQGTVRAMWEARDLPPSTAARHGLSYTHIGNAGATSRNRSDKRPPRTR
jgi:E-phenylitaconyl-CoA hydratase